MTMKEIELITTAINSDMSNYTDKFFKFPVRIHDGVSLSRALRESIMREEDNEEESPPLNTDWVQGWAKINIEEIKGWVDHFAMGRKTGNVAKEGFDQTVILTSSLGEFTCMWDRKRLEEEINKFKPSSES